MCLLSKPNVFLFVVRNEPVVNKPEMVDTSPTPKWKSTMPQVLATMAKNLILLGYGMTLGFPTIVIPSLQNSSQNETTSSSSSSLTLTDEEISWFGKKKNQKTFKVVNSR